jgi:hypothetical protein
MNHGTGARNRTRMPRPKSHEKTDFLYGFGYGSLDTKNVSLDTKNGSLNTKNGSLDMVISFGYGRIFLDMAVGDFWGTSKLVNNGVGISGT